MRQVEVTGPIVTGTARRHGKLMSEEIVDAAGQEALHEVERILDASLQNPTGYYESQITIDRVQKDRVVTDGGVVYGPWLEGVSSRNEKSRFKGYAAFRRATQRTAGRVDQIARPIAAKHVKAMNG